MILILVVTVMAALLLSITYFLDFIVTEKKIAQSQYLATEAYYLTEAGIQQAIWKVSHDPTWLVNFQTDPDWQTSFDLANPMDANQSYHVAAQNNGLGNAQVVVTGHLNLGDKQSQRVVKTTVFQAQGPAATSSVALFSDNELNFNGVNAHFVNAGIFANNNIKVNLSSTINVDGNASAANNISISWLSHLNAAHLYDKDHPPKPAKQEMAQIDFDSNNAASLLKCATAVYTSNQFDQLLNQHPTLTLNGLIFVDGNLTIPRGVNLTVNGALVASGNISIGADLWPFWLSGPILTINDPGSGPAGLLAKRKINVGSYADTLAVNGLIYANDEFKIDAYGLNFNLNGGFITRTFTVSSLWQTLVINYNEAVIKRTLGLPQAAPIINVDHWEEEY